MNKIIKFYKGLITNKKRPLRYLYIRTISFIEKYLTYQYLIRNGVETKYGYVKLIGIPVIRKHPFSTIKIGKGVTIVSKTKGNILGINHSTILATLHADAKIIIGEGSGVSGASIIAVDSIIIGKNVGIGANCSIFDTDFHSIDLKSRKKQVGVQDLRKAKYSPIKIENDVILGLEACVLKGVTIKSGSVVGARSVVTKDIDENTIFAGNPAKFIKKIQ
jgi:acetyltransferase-like isoleucine patch superfamily enzyme